MNFLKLASVLLCSFSMNLSVQAAGNKSISIDGSSTVFPITEAVAEEFKAAYSKINVNIGVSGTGGGFKKFVAKEIDISNASRKIKTSEADAAKKNGVNYTELAVAYDGITIVVNPKNTWATTLTVEELKKIWGKDSKVVNWSDVRKEWPSRKIKLYGPGTDSGTFDFFTEAINGKAGESRSDYVKSEDDNVLVTGVSGDTDAMGYFGYSYYKENQKKLKAVTIDGGKGPIMPSVETIKDGTYFPLSRAVYMYVNNEAYKREEVQTFLNFFLQQAEKLVAEVGYIPMTAKTYKEDLNRIKSIK